MGVGAGAVAEAGEVDDSGLRAVVSGMAKMPALGLISKLETETNVTSPHAGCSMLAATGFSIDLGIPATTDIHPKLSLMIH